MKRSSEMINCIAELMFNVALAGWMFCLAVLNFDFTVMRLSFPLLCLAAFAAYGIDRFLLNRGVPAPLFVAVQVLLTSAGGWLYVSTICIEPYVLRTVVITCAVYCCTFPAAAYMAYYGVGKNGMLLSFDILTVLMIFLLFLSYFKSMPALGSTLIMCGAALAVTVVSQISERAGRYSSDGAQVQGSAVGGRLLLAGALLAVLIFAGLIVLLAFGGLESVSHLLVELLTAIVNGVKAVLAFLYAQLERFVRWLASMMEDTTVGDAGFEMAGGMDVAVDYGDSELNLPGWLIYVGIGLGVALLAWIMFRLRRSAVKRVSRRMVRRRVRTKRESGLSLALAGIFAGLKRKLLYRFNCVRYRKTAPGLLAWCEKKAGDELCRRQGESGQQFLLRLARTRENAEEGAGLYALAEAVERSFYSPHPASVSRELYSRIRKLKFT